MLQSALVCCAAGPVTLLVISMSDFTKHATPEVLRAMRDEASSQACTLRSMTCSLFAALIRLLCRTPQGVHCLTCCCFIGMIICCVSFYESIHNFQKPVFRPVATAVSLFGTLACILVLVLLYLLVFFNAHSGCVQGWTKATTI